MIFVNTCTDWPVEGFATKEIPRPLNITDHSLKNVTGANSVTDLPSAPVSGLSDVNSLPQTDPAMEKGSLQMLNELKQDMNGFYNNEYPYIKDRSDPAINLPLTRFIGDYQRVKDEMSVLNGNPGIPAQISIQEINDVGANLRYLQRIYRSLADVELVPATSSPLSLIGTEGFVNPDDKPISLERVKLLNVALEAEIKRLKASGTTDPVMNARINIFITMKQTVSDIITQVSNGSMAESAIPIKEKDYKNFLPSLGKSTGQIGSLVSNTTQPQPIYKADAANAANAAKAVADVANAAKAKADAAAAAAKAKADADVANVAKAKAATDTAAAAAKAKAQADDAKARADDAKARADANNNQSALTNPADFLNKYMDNIMNGISFSYTSPNDLAKQKALASYANSFETSRLNPGTSRGEFDTKIRKLDAFENGGEDDDLTDNQDNSLDGFMDAGSVRPRLRITANAGSFDWKKRATSIKENIERAGLNPGDYGCLEDNSSVGKGFSWRGYTKMVCSRLSANADPGAPEQMGCPPVSWKGWRS